MSEISSQLWMAGFGGGGLLCLASLIWIYNLWVAISMMRDKEAEPAAGLAKAAWGVSLAAWFLGPCGIVFGLAGVIMGRMVTAKVYREEAPISSNRPAAMASINFGLYLFFFLLLAAFVFVMGSAAGGAVVEAAAAS